MAGISLCSLCPASLSRKVCRPRTTGAETGEPGIAHTFAAGRGAVADISPAKPAVPSAMSMQARKILMDDFISFTSVQG